MKLQKASVVYYSKNLKKYTVVENFNSEDFENRGKVLVEDDQGRVYLEADEVYFNLESAQKRQELNKAIYHLRNSDIAEMLTNKIFLKQ